MQTNQQHMRAQCMQRPPHDTSNKARRQPRVCPCSTTCIFEDEQAPTHRRTFYGGYLLSICSHVRNTGLILQQAFSILGPLLNDDQMCSARTLLVAFHNLGKRWVTFYKGVERPSHSFFYLTIVAFHTFYTCLCSLSRFFLNISFQMQQVPE